MMNDPDKILNFHEIDW